MTTLQLNRSNGRPKRPKSAATIAREANQFDTANGGTGIELLDGTTVSLLVSPNWEHGFVADKAQRKHTYHTERKFGIGDKSAITRPEDGAQLILAKTSLVYATPEYLAEKAQTAETTRWRNLAAAIAKGLADPSGMGLTTADLQAWIDGADESKRWLFKLYEGNGVQFCDSSKPIAVEFAMVGEVQQRTIQKHLTAALKRAGVITDGLPVDINGKIAQLENMLAEKYSAQALAKFDNDPEYKLHLQDWANGKRAELKRLLAKRGKDAKTAAAKAAKQAAKGGK